ncbi:MAG: DUF3102 domain-containing protein [Chroococcidiopsidaceae cyanobacterium CP_BM_RX_35]|nr:DUF3102 domain-containing protein [Chroococcidiopsidaceae cyanobacterium CP_BM_RX_35]
MNIPLKEPASDLEAKFSTQLDLDFDYEKLPYETRIIVQQRTSEIKRLLKQTAQELLDIGQKLIEVKEQLGHGNFGNWLKAEFGWGITTAWKLMKSAEAFKFSHCENLDIAASAMYLLAAPSTPHEARQEALKRASDGEKITYTKAKEIIAQYREAAKIESDESRTFVAGQTVARDVANPQLLKAVPSWQIEPLKEPESVVETKPDIRIEREETAIPARTEEELDNSASSKTSLSFTLPISMAFEEDDSYSFIAEAVLQCLGEIDLYLGNQIYYGPPIPAMTQLLAENSLTSSWQGRIFINLPFTDGLNNFVDKLCTEFESRRVTEALALFSAQTSAQWFRRLREYPRCFLNERLGCLTTDNREPSSKMVFYLGQEPEGLRKFSRAFNRLGDIFVLVE